MCCMIQFASILLRIFTLMFIRDIDLKPSLFHCVSTRFWCQDDAGLIECLTEKSPFYYYLEEFQKEWYQLLFVLLVEFSCELV